MDEVNCTFKNKEKNQNDSAALLDPENYCKSLQSQHKCSRQTEYKPFQALCSGQSWSMVKHITVLRCFSTNVSFKTQMKFEFGHKLEVSLQIFYEVVSFVSLHSCLGWMFVSGYDTKKGSECLQILIFK